MTLYTATDLPTEMTVAARLQTGSLVNHPSDGGDRADPRNRLPTSYSVALRKFGR